MKENNSLVSIVTPAYNSSKYILETIKSVQKQTYSNFELLIIDDCSTDDTFEKSQGISNDDKRIKVFKTKKNEGTASARNLGIEKANGRYLVFLDSDDLLDPSFLEKQIRFLRNKQCSIATAGYRRLAPNSCTEFIPPLSTTYKTILNGNPVSCLTTIIDLKKVGKHYFDVELLKCEDFYFWIKLLKIGHSPIYGNPEVLATYRILQTSKSRNKFKLIKWMLRVYKKAGINFFSRYFHLIKWMFYGLKKYKNVR
jgi:teichuronic acid biosynthesis glycosyltransferase TuaG